MICRNTMQECRTPSMCAPFNGCVVTPDVKIAKLEERVERLERLMAHVCPDKSDDV